MTRDEFLKNIWPPYPYFSELNPDKGAWICGKISSLDSDRVALHGGEAHPVEPGNTHAVLGPALPLSLAALGDCVALEKRGSGFAGPYLLSPNLAGEEAPAVSASWQSFLELVRSFFISRGFRSWSTPYLVASSGVDAHIDFMTVRGIRTGRPFYLPTSPEFELKKAVAAGEQRIFEIKSCFRDDDAGPIHRPEFTMLEWYRAYDDKWTLLRDFEELASFVESTWGNGPATVKPRVNAERVSMAELFKRHVDFQLTPQTSMVELQSALRDRDLHFTDADDWDDLFFRLYIELVEPHLGHHHPVAVYDFPATQSSLARQTAGGWADRFEIYWRGVELANSYQEQNNPYLVSDVVQREISKRTGLDRTPHQTDASFLRAMRGGFPPCAGAALGLDRLYMVLRKAPNISCK